MSNQQADVSISNDALFEPVSSNTDTLTESPAVDVEAPAQEELTEEVDVEEVLNQFQDPQSYLQNIVDNFGEDQKAELEKSVEDYVQLTTEYEERVNTFFESNPNPREEIDFESLHLDSKDERYSKVWQNVLPILDVLIESNKVDAAVFDKIKDANQRLGRASLLLNSFVLHSEQESDSINAQLDSGVLQTVFRMTEYQFTNILRTLNIARAENRLKFGDIEELTNIAQNIRDNTINYLRFLEIDGSIISEIHSVVLGMIEKYKSFATE